MATLSTLGALIAENVASGARDLMFRKTDLLQTISAYGGRMESSNGSAPFKWVVVTGINASAGTFVEGQAPGVPGAQTFTKASLDVFGVEANWTMTGHSADNAAKNGYVDDAPGLEEVLGKADFAKKVEDLICGSTADQGIASIVDAGDTYAGIAPGSVAQWASVETAVGGALTMSSIDDLYEALTSASSSGVARGAMPNVILAHPKQIKKYSQLAGVAGAANNSVLVSPDGSKGLDLAFKWAAASYQGIPLVQIRTLANSELYMLDMTDFALIEHRAPRVDVVSTNPELMQWRVSSTMALKVEKRSQHGKLTGLT
jgi:hypothetical protein